MKLKKTLFIILALSLGGCFEILSLNPTYTPDTIVFNSDLIGQWTDPNDPNSKEIWTFSRASDPDQNDFKNFYQLNISPDDPNGCPLNCLAALTNIDNILILDILPTEFPCSEKLQHDPSDSLHALLFIRSHSFMKMHITNQFLTLTLPSQDNFEDILEKHPSEIQYQILEQNPEQIVITDSTNNIRDFIKKFGKEQTLFSEKIKLKRKTSNE